MKRSVDHKKRINPDPMINMTAVEVERLNLMGSVRFQGGVDRKKLWVNIFRPQLEGNMMMIRPILMVQHWNTGGSYLKPDEVENIQR
jgi:hypothetical protein